MKVVNFARYIDDVAKVAKLRPSHRAFMADLFSQGRAVAGGPFADGSRALFVHEVESVAEAEGIVARDPYTIGGAIRDYELKIWQIVGSNAEPLIHLA